jgi:hypothetical protein
MNKVCCCLMLALPVFLVSCGQPGSGGGGTEPVELLGDIAFVAVVDNSASFSGSSLESLYNAFPGEMRIFLGGIFSVDPDDLDGMPLDAVVEQYGEPWIISTIEAQADADYDEWTVLNNGTATLDGFLDTVEQYNDNGRSVDVLWCLHAGSTGLVLFSDDSYYIDDIIDEMVSRNLSVRSLYQTCCFGSRMTDEWEDYGIHAVNGSRGENIYVMFSSGYFLDYWTAGAGFSQSVQQARSDEITELQLLLKAAAADNPFFQTALGYYDFAGSSVQDTEGACPSLEWSF